MNYLASYIRDLWQGRRSGVADRLLQIVLKFVALLYRCSMGLRARCYRYGLLKTHTLPRPVISVGNITVGGTGKTPVTAWIARHLLQQGLRVAVLSRGYGGTLEGQTAIVSDGEKLLLTPDQSGDEPYLLASTVPGLMVVIGSDRYRAGTLAMEKATPDVFLLDDGYQHLRLHRDLNLLLLDCSKPFGNGQLLPAGPLRESISALQRADLILYTRCSTTTKPAHLLKKLPFCLTSHHITSFHRLDTGDDISLESLHTARVAAFAGIADPEGFFTSLRLAGIQLQETLPLADHEPYGHATAASLEKLALQTGAAWLLTTEKDGVKLLDKQSSWSSKVVIARLELVFEDETFLRQSIQAAFKTAPHMV
jgi:tetraacyldisaccharide 4'-kinase